MVNLWEWYFQNMAEHRHPCLSRVCLTARIVNSIDFHQATVLHISLSPGADMLICAVVEHGGWYRCAWAIGSGTRACAMHEMQWLCDGHVCLVPACSIDTIYFFIFDICMIFVRCVACCQWHWLHVHGKCTGVVLLCTGNWQWYTGVCDA